MVSINVLCIIDAQVGKGAPFHMGCSLIEAGSEWHLNNSQKL